MSVVGRKRHAAERRWFTSVFGLLVAGAALVACSEPIQPRLGTADEALTQTVTIRRGTFGTVADATISASALTTNYGAQNQLQVSARNEALLRFDLASIPANAVIESADLTLAINGGENEADDDVPDGDHEGHRIAPIELQRVTAAWAEGTVTYRSFDQQFSPVVAGTIILANRTSSKTVDVRGLVQGWVAGTYPNFGLVLTTAGKQHTLVVSSEHAAIARRPALTIRYALPDDHCTPDPCVHGACTNTLDSFTCECDPGFDGATCDHDIDECASNPCENGGTCTDGLAGFTCACAAGFSGVTCADNVDECSPNPCQNGGTCTDGFASYTCACVPGTSGADCEIVDVCSETSNPCQNGGTCTLEAGNTYSCACPAGFTGVTCETNPIDCPAVDACSGHGTCVDGLDSYTCTCDPGHTGPDCETPIVTCASEPCLNGGTCADTADGYTCACAAGYDGETCANDINDCAAHPCQNDGACVDGVNSFTCQCPSGYGGAACEGVCQSMLPAAVDSEFPVESWALLSGGSVTDEWGPRFGSQVTSMYEIVDGTFVGQFVNQRLVAFLPGTYDPSVSGALARLDYTFDAQDRTGYPNVILQIQVVLLQGGNAYVPVGAFQSANFSAVPAPGPWLTTAQTSLTAADFEQLGPASGHPDFSAGAAPITFGYVATAVNVTSPSTSRLLVQFAFDNFSVSVLPASLDCDNADECAADLDSCAPAPAGVCTNTIGSYTCACADGYTGDGVTCRATTDVTLSPPDTTPYGAATTLSATLVRLGAPAGPIAQQPLIFTMRSAAGDDNLLGLTGADGVATVSYVPPVSGWYQVLVNYLGSSTDAPSSDVGSLFVACPAGYDGPTCTSFVCDASCAACSGPAANQCTACDATIGYLDLATNSCVPWGPPAPIDGSMTVMYLPASVQGGSLVQGVLQARDSDGNNVPSGGAAFGVTAITATGSTTANVIDNADGTYTFTFTAPPYLVQAPSFEVRVFLDGAPLPHLDTTVTLVP